MFGIAIVIAIESVIVVDSMELMFWLWIGFMVIEYLLIEWLIVVELFGLIMSWIVYLCGLVW